MSAHPTSTPRPGRPGPTDPTLVSQEERADLALRSRLNHLLLLRYNLRREHHPVPQELNDLIRDIRLALGLVRETSGHPQPA